MTEMAPVGHVGISPKCILGLNKVSGKTKSILFSNKTKERHSVSETWNYITKSCFIL